MTHPIPNIKGSSFVDHLRSDSPSGSSVLSAPSNRDRQLFSMREDM